MGATQTRQLFIQVTGSADGLSAASKVAKSVLLDTGVAAKDLQKAVQDSFAEMGGSGLQNAAKSMEAAYKKSFATIRASAEAALANPGTGAAALTVNLPAAQAELASAQARVTVYRTLADAQQRVVASSTNVTEAQRVLTVSLEAQAIAAEQDVAALRTTVDTLAPLQAEMVRTGEAGVDMGAKVSSGHARMGSSGLIAEHVIRSLSDSIAAGQSPVRALTMEMGRITEAMTLFAATSGATEGALGKFAGFMGGPWGLAISVGAALLTPLIGALFETHEAAKLAELGSDGLSEAQGALGKMFDLTSGKLQHQNELLRLNAQLTAINLRAEAAQARTSAQETTDSAQHGDIPKRLLDTIMAGVTDPKNPFVGMRDTRDANVGRIGGVLRGVQSGSVTKESALAQSEKLDFTGSKITKEQFQKAIIDAATAPVKDKIADEIDKSLTSGTLDKGLRQDAKARKPKADHSVERAANADRAYQAELGTAQDAYAKALLALGDTAEGRLAIEKDELQAALAQKLLEIDDQVKAKKINETQADRLKQLATATEALQEEEAARKERSALLAQAYGLEKQQLDQQMSLLQIDLDFADTRKQRLALERQILADQQKARLDGLNKTISDPTTSPADKALAENARNALPAQDAAEQGQLDKKYQSPIAAYRDQLLSATSDMNDALQGVAVDGLKGIEDGFAGIITGTQTVAGAFKSMAASILGDLAKIAAEKAIAGILGGSIFGGLFGGGSSGGGFSALGSVGLQDSYASGGHVLGAGSGTSDSILARLSNGEFVMNAAATKRNLPLLHAMNEGRLPGFAAGGIVAANDIHLPDLTRSDMRSLSRSSVSVSLGGTTLIAPGADAAALARLQAAFEQSQQELPARATAAVQDAMDRLVIRR